MIRNVLIDRNTGQAVLCLLDTGFTQYTYNATKTVTATIRVITGSNPQGFSMSTVVITDVEMHNDMRLNIGDT